ESYRPYDAGVEKRADDNCHPDGAKESLSTELGACFFRGFAHRLEAGHEVRDDLNYQQNRDQRSVREQWREMRNTASACPCRDEHNEKRERTEARSEEHTSELQSREN